MLKTKLKPYLGLLLPIIIILGLVAYPYITVSIGDEILIETIPYDPTDLFRGDYVQLRYAISELDDSYFEDVISFTEEDAYTNHSMYAVLKKEDKVHVVDYLTKERPKKGIYLNCSVYLYHQYRTETSKKDPFIIDVDYNINRYYLKEGTGLDLEEASREGQLLGKLKVYKGKGILIDIIEKE